MIKYFLKKFRDSYLFSIRKQVYDLIERDSRITDLGCGDGELLRILAPKISYGLGVDKDRKEIAFAKQLTKKIGIKNLEFAEGDITEHSGNFDYSILMLVLHSLDYKSREKVLKNARKNSDKVIIVDYENPSLLGEKLFIHADEMLTGHYGNFRDYLKMDGIESFLKRKSVKKFNTDEESIKIWKINQK